MQIILDVLRMKEKKEAQDYLKEQLGLPEYYGCNLDSLYDCLTEMGQTEIVLIHGECIEGYAKRVVKVIRHAAAENQEIKYQEVRKMSLPKDPVMLMSVVNTQLRDQYPSLAELAAAHMVDVDELIQKLAQIDYHYDEKKNQFV